MFDTAKTLPGNATVSGGRGLVMNSRKRTRAASSGMPKSSQRRMWSLSVGRRQGFTATNRMKPGRLDAACHSAALRSKVEYGAFR